MSGSDEIEQYAKQQQLIDAILTTHAGCPGPLVVDVLRATFRAHGLPCPPDTWLSAVAADVSIGHVYVVSATVTPLPMNQER
jgi:hypothetical protein